MRGEQAISELFAVAGQQLDDFDGAGLLQRLQGAACTGGGLVGLDGHVDPAGRLVDGHEVVAPVGLVRHLRQVVDVPVQVARRVALERLV